MRVAVAMDSFKGSLTSLEAGQQIAKGITTVDSTSIVDVFEVSDGGEGSLNALKNGLVAFEEVSIEVPDTLGRIRKVSYLITDWHGKRTALIESALVIGLESITPSPETIQKGTSFGLGQLMKDALVKRCECIIIFLGGTATSDGGLGLLSGLGEGDVTINQNLLFTKDLEVEIEPLKEELKEIDILIGSDVTNPFYGESGFANVFAKQKGATVEQIVLLDQQAKKFADNMQKTSGIDLNQIAGTGAAGGIAGSLVLLGGTIHSGFDLISELTYLDEKLQLADVIYTGEGSLDSQSAQGKLPMKICELAQKANIPVIALVGRRSEDIGELSQTLLATFSIQLGPISLEDALKKETAKNQLMCVAIESYRLFQY
ncbi:glycerate kinase family protein [Carnobacterium gallinarum]|uniref:glycerate kinase family protein n=1 Tax=Carnobacterium gallinarum TaxID=2749 RepID=UPI0005521B0F|nr:glycerate kinase [Carnobacterium gallinarum]